MAEYIKIEKKTFPTFYKRNLNDYGKGWNACLKSVLQHKTVEVAEIKYGKWNQNPYHKTIYYCSECGRHIECASIYPYKFFPYCHCGAKMQK